MRFPSDVLALLSHLANYCVAQRVLQIGRQGLPQGKVRGKHGIKQAGVVLLPVHIQVAINGPKNFGAGKVFQPFQQRALAQMFSLNDKIGLKVLFVQKLGHVE